MFSITAWIQWQHGHMPHNCDGKVPLAWWLQEPPGEDHKVAHVPRGLNESLLWENAPQGTVRENLGWEEGKLGKSCPYFVFLFSKWRCLYCGFSDLKLRPTHHRKYKIRECREESQSPEIYHHPGICVNIFNIFPYIFLFLLTLSQQPLPPHTRTQHL